MSIPTVYHKRIVNPDWLYYWKLAHSKNTLGVFTPNFVSPETYITIDCIATTNLVAAI